MAGPLHILGEHDRSHGRAVRDERTGVIVRASGRQGTAAPWRFEVEEIRLLEDDTQVAEPLVKLVFEKIGSDTEEDMTTVLNRLAAAR